MLKRVLMIAYHFPPMRGKSGTQRTLNFCKFLPEYGWEPFILTVNEKACHDITEGSQNLIPGSVNVKRAFAFDAKRHFRLAGRYPRLLAMPDRWASWWLSAVPLGLQLIHQYQPDIIWTTYPIATSHLVGMTLNRLTGLNWVADFRDSMTEENYPDDPNIRKIFQWIERKTVYNADRSVFTTKGTRQMYARRYKTINNSRLAVIPNGYNHEIFDQLGKKYKSPRNKKLPYVLLHSGLLYRSERDPTCFFSALEDLYKTGKISSSLVKVVLRDSKDEDYYKAQLKKMGLEELVLLKPAIPFNDAISEMLEADGLLVFQASNCNHQIPAKVYEYFRSGKPIFALTDPAGDTAKLLEDVNVTSIVQIDNKDNIKKGILKFLDQLQKGTAPVPNEENIVKHSRKHRTKELAELFDSLL